MKEKRVGIGLLFLLVAGAALITGTACSSSGDEPTGNGADALAPLTLPNLEPAVLDGGRLKVLATTGIIGDVVGQVGGQAIDLTVLMAPGQDPHSYEPAARDLTAASEAAVIFINGWDMEEGLVDDLENAAGEKALVPISAGITPLPFGHQQQENGEEEDDHHGADPHVWLDPHHVEGWVKNVEQVLVDLDPDNAQEYGANAEVYLEELAALIDDYDHRLGQIPADRRKIVTNHDSLSYFAETYDFDIIGTVIPGASTLAEPSARDLAQLVTTMEEAGVCSIFTETTANDRLVEAAAGELDGCQHVQIVSLYTGTLGQAGSGADNYIDMMRANLEAISGGLMSDG